MLNTMITTQPYILRDLENIGIEFVLPRYIDGLLSALKVPFYNTRDLGESKR